MISKKIFLLLLLGILLLSLFSLGIYTIAKKHSALPSHVDQQGYIVKGNKVYYRTTMDISNDTDGYYTEVNDQEIMGAYAKTFTILDPYWAKDSENIFYMGQKILPETGTLALHIASFTLVEKSNGLAKDFRAVYIVSPNQNGWSYRAIQDADPDTFTLVEGGPYAKDKKNVYYLDMPFEVRKIEGADGKTFAVLGQCAAVEVSRAYYGIDAQSVIAGDKVLQGADRNTFTIVASYDNGPDGMYAAGTYSIDKNHVYKNCGEITKGNPATCSSFNLKACE